MRCEAKVSVTAAQLLLCTHCPENVTWLNITQLSMSCYAGECMPQLGAHKVHLDDWRTNAPGWPWMMETSNKISLETPRECSCEQTQALPVTQVQVCKCTANGSSTGTLQCLCVLHIHKQLLLTLSASLDSCVIHATLSILLQAKEAAVKALQSSRACCCSACQTHCS